MTARILIIGNGFSVNYGKLHPLGILIDGLAVDYDGVMQLHAVQSASGRVPADCPLLDVPASPASQ